MEKRITLEQLKYFKKNYIYMWSKLNVTYYDIQIKHKGRHPTVSGTLPAYSICSRCMNDDEYIPSWNTVRKFVDFYNENISPQIDVFKFLNEDLSINDPYRYRHSSVSTNRFIGHYWGYYPSADLDDSIVGAYLRIFEADNMIRAAMVTGVRSDDQLNHPGMKRIFEDEQPQYKKYVDYYDGRTPEHQRCYYYEGNVEISNKSILIIFHGVDKDRRKLILTMNIECFPLGFDRPYYGGLAFATATSDGPFDTRFYKMGFINTRKGYLSLNNTELPEILKITSRHKSVMLTSTEDRKWYRLILDKT